MVFKKSGQFQICYYIGIINQEWLGTKEIFCLVQAPSGFEKGLPFVGDSYGITCLIKPGNFIFDHAGQMMNIDDDLPESGRSAFLDSQMKNGLAVYICERFGDRLRHLPKPGTLSRCHDHCLHPVELNYTITSAGTPLFSRSPVLFEKLSEQRGPAD